MHKLGIVLKELNETLVWLRMIERSEILKSELLAGIIEENRELCRLFTSSLKTARTNKMKWKIENGKWKMKNGIWQMANEPTYTHVLSKGGRGAASQLISHEWYTPNWCPIQKYRSTAGSTSLTSSVLTEVRQ